MNIATFHMLHFYWTPNLKHICHQESIMYKYMIFVNIIHSHIVFRYINLAKNIIDATRLVSTFICYYIAIIMDGSVYHLLYPSLLF